MTIELQECNGTQAGLFEDLAAYRNVNKWLAAMRDGKDAIRALDVFVIINGCSYRFCSAGQLTDDADKIIKRVAKLPAVFRSIPNDTMKIKADTFESELFITMGG